MDPVVVVTWVAAGVLIAIGAVGVVVPALPGAPLILLGALLAAWGEGFEYLGLGSLLVLGVLAALAVGVDVVAGAFGVKRFGASPRAMTGATIGALVGLFLGVPGVLLGPFVGAAIGELTVRRNLRAASRAGVGATLGLVFGTVAKLGIAVAMVGFIAAMRLA
jgi:hypothetical protein